MFLATCAFHTAAVGWQGYTLSNLPWTCPWCPQNIPGMASAHCCAGWEYEMVWSQHKATRGQNARVVGRWVARTRLPPPTPVARLHTGNGSVISSSRFWGVWERTCTDLHPPPAGSSTHLLNLDESPGSTSGRQGNSY